MASAANGVKERNRLTSEEIRWHCPEGCLDFETTNGVAPVQGTIGQERALRALKIGLELYAPGYNIYVSGLVGTGRRSTVKELLAEISPRCAVSRDRAYVKNFTDRDKPRLLSFPAGEAVGFRRDLEEFVRLLKTKLPAKFEGKEVAEQRERLAKRFGEKEQEQLEGFQERLREEGFALVTVQSGPVPHPDIFPLIEDQPAPPQKLQELLESGELSEERLKELGERIEEYRKELREHLRRGRDLARELAGEIEKLHQAIGRAVIGGSLEDLRRKYAENEAVVEFLGAVEQDVLDHLPLLATHADEADGAIPQDQIYRRYEVNVISDRTHQAGCAVVVANNPTYVSLFGTIEREMEGPGVWRTDHTMIRGGQLLEADGGYLILNVLDVLTQPGVWPTLLRALKSGCLEIQVPELPFIGLATGLKPEPIDLNVKVILVGEPHYYHLLFQHDPDFQKIFKIKAEFTPDMDLRDENLDHFAKVLAKICEQEELRPLSRDALGTIAEYAVRRAGRKDKISTRFAEAGDVVREADYWCREAGDEVISRDHVRRSIHERSFRVSGIDNRLRELIEKDVIVIRTEGEAVGQVNGLSVMDLGYHAFGKPTLITASTAVGQSGLINIEREARLSGGIYDKGVLIISGYLRRIFAQRRPLALTASLCFEQSYAGVDGDSASIAEIFALLSELSGIPLTQEIAVTGSISQRGEIQPVGGVNEKIEGYFELCEARGLSGRQGVILPRRNVGDLMLKQRVVDAVESGRFHVWAISSVEDGIEIMTGVSAGERDETGEFPEGTVFRAVDDRLGEYLDALHRRDLEQDWKPIQTVPGAPAAGEPPPEPGLPPPEPGLPSREPPTAGRSGAGGE